MSTVVKCATRRRRSLWTPHLKPRPIPPVSRRQLLALDTWGCRTARPRAPEMGFHLA